MGFRIKVGEPTELEKFLNWNERERPRIVKVKVRTFKEKENFFRVISGFSHIYVSSAGVQKVREERGRLVFSEVNSLSSSDISILRPGGSFDRFISNLKRGIDNIKQDEILIVSIPENLLDPEDRNRAEELISQLLFSKEVSVILLETSSSILNPLFIINPPAPTYIREKEKLFSFVEDEILRKDLLKIVFNLSLEETEVVAFRVRELNSFSEEAVLKKALNAKGEMLSQNTGIIYKGIRSEVAVGYEDLVDNILQKIEVNQNLNLNLILSGIPGTGKTLFAYYLSNSLFLPLYEFDPSSLRDSYFGKTEQKLRDAIDALRKAGPCIILIDEYEKLMHVPANSSVADTLLATRVQVLKFLEDQQRNSIVIATSNHANLLSPEELRRFHLRLFVDLPSGERAFQILSYYLPEVETLSEKEREWIKRKLDRLFSGQLIKEVAQAVKLQREEFSFSHLQRTIEQFLPVAVEQKIKADILRASHSSGGFVRL